jgi:hypothetical protein
MSKNINENDGVIYEQMEQVDGKSGHMNNYVK